MDIDWAYSLRGLISPILLFNNLEIFCCFFKPPNIKNDYREIVVLEVHVAENTLLLISLNQHRHQRLDRQCSSTCTCLNHTTHAGA